ncbi:MAG: class I tRNA ligase family protein, partial [Candidatus Levybacteria bacterium]|nr:class I tRNA ligase family protein [Candidatus Levybacteria bacterium]
AVRVSLETDKKDSADFALWKKAEKDRLMKWDSPWGPPAGGGFPGWHIECSAMSMKYLGKTIDIHTGGEDLIFPHHEDEIAQSEGATDQKFVRYWLHGGYLLVDNQKMSRSKGNVYTISDLEKRDFHPLTFRYLSMMTHYRQKMNFTWEALEGAKTALNRLYEEVSTWDEPRIGCAEYEQKFLDAINNDLNMPEALSIVWDLIKSDYPTHAKAESLFKMDEVLGLNLRVPRVSRVPRVPQEVIALVREREELRKKKRYHLSDQLRNKIKKLGYDIQDNDDGTTKIKGGEKA